MNGHAGDSSSRGGVGGGISASLLRFWTRSYAADYFGFSILLVAYILMESLTEPFHRMFYINDLAISFPHAEVERVPVTMNFVYALFIPLAILLLYNTILRSPWHKHHVTILGLGIALVLTSTLTDTIKNAVGRPRPDLISRCKPRASTPRDTLVTIAVCTETDHHTLHDGWRSFPSGHSSFSFAGLGYLSFFLAGQLKIFVLGGGSNTPSPPDDDNHPSHVERVVITDAPSSTHRNDLSRALLCLLPLVGALIIAISRCQDYRHDVYDVCTGGLLGYVVAYWSYRRYWPRLSSRRSDQPYPSPADSNISGPGGLRYGPLSSSSRRYYGRDEEEGGAGGLTTNNR